jgi:hypothetical protein
MNCREKLAVGSHQESRLRTLTASFSPKISVLDDMPLVLTLASI